LLKAFEAEAHDFVKGCYIFDTRLRVCNALGQLANHSTLGFLEGGALEKLIHLLKQTGSKGAAIMYSI